jgi:hypothetical protein
MEGCHTFSFTHLLGSGLVNETMVQRIIDGVNMILKEFPNAWEFVRQGGLIQDGLGTHPVVKSVFTQMMKDDHTSLTATLSIRLVTELAQQRGLELGLGRINPD